MAPLSPTRLGRYEILDEIGKGAMGVVYLAKDPLIGRLVALKTFRIGYSVRDQELEQFRARFIREAQSAGILSHPNIVTVHDVVEEGEDGVAFIAMEYVRGTNLKMLLQGGVPLDLPFAAEILRQVAEALDYAHSKGVVHRDVKPANIIITADNRVKITDFGIARLDSSNLTQEGQLLGTPNYMAPEQILGKDADHRSDIFSLGVVLYEMLTRHKPFQGENLTVVSHRIVYDPFTPPEQFVRDLPGGVDKVLTRALEKDPGRRYQRAHEMAEDLDRIVGVRPASAVVLDQSLNETQSLSSTALLPALPPPSADDATASRPVVAPLASVPVPPAAQRGFSLRRAVLASGAAAILMLLLGATVLLALAWTSPTVQPADPQSAEVMAAMPHVREGHRLLRAAKHQEAAVQYSAAAKKAPGWTGLGRLVAEAERRAGEYEQHIGDQQAISEKLAEARQAMGARRYTDALVAASAVLGMEPENAEATGIIRTVEAIEAGRRDRLAAGRLAGAPEDGPETPSVLPTLPIGGSEPVDETSVRATGETTLHLKVYSHISKGLVMVRLGTQEVLRKPFDFSERGRFLRPRPGKGWIDYRIPVEPGVQDVWVYITPEGQGAIPRRFQDSLFSAGQTREITGELSADKRLDVQLK